LPKNGRSRVRADKYGEKRMVAVTRNTLNRRLFISGAATVLTAAALPAAAQQAGTTEMDVPLNNSPVRNNTSAFRMLNWQDYFSNSRNGVIVADLESRALHYWSEDLSIYKLYPSSVPLNEELTRRGHTEVIQKVENPRWIPTVGELERNPDWPKVVAGGSPENPLGVRALYLDWPAFRIHGTHDTRKIGRRSSNGCVGLYNEHILELYALAKVGTQVVFL
jgi:lipoprotein-anchoring transpeptidase ErfK/SrfK